MIRFFQALATLLFLSITVQAQYLNYSDYADELADIVNRVQLEHDTAYSLGGTKVSDACVSFMTKDMFLGASGRQIFETIKKNQASFPQIMKGGNLTNYCPKYTTMKADQRAMVWVMLLTMVAHFESSCSMKAKAKGPNGTAKGFYQLHQGKEQNYDDLQMCVRNASLSDKASGKCALSMIERQLTRENGNLFSKKSYWDVLRPNGAAHKADDIQRTLKKSSLCNPSTI